MGAPPVRYTTTRDGYDIAYTVSGAGPDFVCALGVFNHVELTWERRESTGPFLQTLAERFRLIHFDARGQGLSTRGLKDVASLADFCADVEAVVQALALDKFVLYGGSAFSHVAVHYALRHPEHVSALILALSARSGAAWPRSMLFGFPEENWDLYLRARVPKNLSRAEVEAHVASFKQSITQEDFVAFNRLLFDSDISPLLSSLRVPTLVLRDRAQTWFREDEAMKLAAAIPNSRLVAYDSGDSAVEEAAAVARAVDAFIADLPSLAAQAPIHPSPGGRPDGLSAREVQVLQLVAQGKSNAEISEELVISNNTVVRHLSNIFAKIGVHNRTGAATYAHRHGLA